MNMSMKHHLNSYRASDNQSQVNSLSMERQMQRSVQIHSNEQNFKTQSTPRSIARRNFDVTSMSQRTHRVTDNRLANVHQRLADI